MTRADIKPIIQAIPAARQEEARHYGVHPYFTRRPPNVVRAYIERYSQEGGGFITYLDLSILWNHWLGFRVSDEVRDHETIVGGERGHTEEHYKQSLARSIKTSLRLLRPDRWFSIVFQQWDLSYFALIPEATIKSG